LAHRKLENRIEEGVIHEPHVGGKGLSHGTFWWREWYSLWERH
jgi:hypothetical protein